MLAPPLSGKGRSGGDSTLMDQIHFIITGGTIDSHYDGTKDTAVPNKESVIPKFIEELKLYEGGGIHDCLPKGQPRTQ